MSFLCDHEIRALQNEFGVFDVFVDYDSETLPPKTISYGLTSAGYDIRLAPEFKVSTDQYGVFLDPKNPDPRAYREECGKTVVIPPNGSLLGRSLEYIKMPRSCIALCIGKSTYARCSVIANVTPLEPEWEGHITLEISNGSRCPVLVYAYEGIIQLLFERTSSVCLRSYKDKRGKSGGHYQGQTGIQMPKVTA